MQDILKALWVKLGQVYKSCLKPQQRLMTLRRHIVALFIMYWFSKATRTRQEYSILRRNGVTYQRTLNSKIHAEIKYGGLGIPSLSLDVVVHLTGSWLLHSSPIDVKPIQLGPEIEEDCPMNLNILKSGGKENNCDFLSTSEWNGKSPSLNCRSSRALQNEGGNSQMPWASAMQTQASQKC